MMTGTRSHATEANARKSVVALLDELEFNDGKLRSAAFGGAAEESCLDSKVDPHASDPPRPLVARGNPCLGALVPALESGRSFRIGQVGGLQVGAVRPRS